METLLTPELFERELRLKCDKAFSAPAEAKNPVKLAIDGKLSLEKAREYWNSRWTTVLLENRFIFSKLIEGADEMEPRVALFNAVNFEYGRGYFTSSMPYLFRKFLVSIGVPAEKLDFELSPTADLSLKVAKWEKMSWLECLSYYLARESVAAKVYESLADGLGKQLRVSQEDLSFFNFLENHSQTSTEVLFSIIAHYANTSDKQSRVMKTLDDFYLRSDYADYCHNHGACFYSFANVSGSRKAKRNQIQIPAMIIAAGRRYECTAENVSVKGLKLSRGGPALIAKSEVLLYLVDPGSDQELSLIGTVVRSESENQDSGTAIEFDAVKTMELKIGDFLNQAERAVAHKAVEN